MWRRFAVEAGNLATKMRLKLSPFAFHPAKFQTWINTRPPTDGRDPKQSEKLYGMLSEWKSAQAPQNTESNQKTP